MANTTGPGPSAGDDDSWREKFESIFGNNGSESSKSGWDELFRLLPGEDTATRKEELTEFFEKGPLVYLNWEISKRILKAIAYLVTPILTAIVYLFLGSNSTEFAAPDEQLGLLDLPVWVAKELSAGAIWLSGAYWDAVTSFAIGIVPDLPGPIDGVLATLVVVAVTIVAAEVVRQVLLAIVLGLADFDPTGLLTAALTAIGVNR